MSVKMIKGYLTNFSQDQTQEQNFAAESGGYNAAGSAEAARKAYEASIIARMNRMNAAEGKLTPAESKLYATTQKQRDLVAGDPRLGTGGVGEVPSEGTSLAPLGIGLGALAGAAALGYGAYKLAKKKAELKGNGYYAFDQTISKDACRNINSPARTRAQLRKQYPNSRIIKGTTAYQLNPQDFKVAV